jgi:DNA-binding NarL/FixJ family response regulator
MQSPYNVIVIEDDTYALHMMGMLLARDWRTRIMDEISGGEALGELSKKLAKFTRKQIPIDLVIIDSEIPGEPQKPLLIAALFQKFKPRPRLMFTATRMDPVFLKQAAELLDFSGYLLKNEVMFTLADAAVRACLPQAIVTTPGVEELLRELFPARDIQVMCSDDPFSALSAREKDITRLGILYNMAEQELADELLIEPSYVANVMSSIYEILGVHEIARGEKSPAEFFEDPVILTKINRFLPGGSPRRRAANLPAIAFHLLTRQCLSGK